MVLLRTLPLAMAMRMLSLSSALLDENPCLPEEFILFAIATYGEASGNMPNSKRKTVTHTDTQVCVCMYVKIVDLTLKFEYILL